MDSLLVKILVTVVALSILIIIHEGGHYLAARAFGMRVLRYSIGFGPVLFRHQPKGSPTVFQVAAIPFLAYVQIAGMNPHEEVDWDDPELYPNKSLFARFCTIAAGPLANYLTASAIIFGLGVSGNVPNSKPLEPMTVNEVVADSPAATAGLQHGDVIVSADGKAIANVAELIAATAPRANQPTQYIVERDGQRLDPMMVTPADNGGRGQIGVSAMMEHIEVGVWESAKLAIVLPWDITRQQLTGLADMARRGDTKDVGGPVMMGKMVSDAATSGIVPFLSMLMLISVALGMFNLMPFPALDGGRLIFLGYEMIFRRRANVKFETFVHTFGMLFLLGIMVLVTYRDIFG